LIGKNLLGDLDSAGSGIFMSQPADFQNSEILFRHFKIPQTNAIEHFLLIVYKGVTIFSITIFSITIFSIMIFSITIFSITTFSIRH
jgi:hypothetical protein